MEQLSQVPCITFEQKPFKKNGNKKYDVVNEIVVRYKETNSSKDFNLICELTKNLVYKVLKQYHIEMFPEIIQEDIMGDCFSLVLLKSVKSYENNKGSFSTHYTWQLKSYVAGKKRDNTKRAKLYNTVPLVEAPQKGGNSEWEKRNILQPTMDSREERFYRSKQKIMIDLFEGRTSCI